MTDFESSIFRHSVLTISKYLECFDGFPNIEALVDSEKKQSPNMSNSRSCFVKPCTILITHCVMKLKY